MEIFTCEALQFGSIVQLVENITVDFFPFCPMGILNILFPNKQAFDSDQVATMCSRQSLVQTPQETEERQPNPATKPPHMMNDATKYVKSASDEPISDSHDKDIEASIPKKGGPRKQLQQQQKRQHISDVPEESERAKQDLGASHLAFGPQHNESPSSPAQRQPRERGNDSPAPSRFLGSHHRPTMLNSRTPEDAKWQEKISPKVDRILENVSRTSEDMRLVQRALNGLQHDKTETLALQKELKETQNELDKTRAKLEATQKNWKKAASELGQLRSRGTGLYQVTDGELTESMRQLRYEIGSFSVQYFSGKTLVKIFDFQPNQLWKYMLDTTPGSEDYNTHLASGTRCPFVIQSFTWRVLVGEIFGQFRWAPWLQDSVLRVCQSLRPDANQDHAGSSVPTAAEKERKFQLWKATTSALILESAEAFPQVEIQNAVDEYKHTLCIQILDAIGPFVRKSESSIFNDIRHIIERFIVFDREISRQAARVDCVFPSRQKLVQFNPQFMTVETRQVEPEQGQYVQMVTAPALKKRGKSTGEDFESESLLLKMEVTCVPLSP